MRLDADGDPVPGQSHEAHRPSLHYECPNENDADGCVIDVANPEISGLEANRQSIPKAHSRNHGHHQQWRAMEVQSEFQIGSIFVKPGSRECGEDDCGQGPDHQRDNCVGGRKPKEHQVASVSNTVAVKPTFRRSIRKLRRRLCSSLSILETSRTELYLEVHGFPSAPCWLLPCYAL